MRFVPASCLRAGMRIAKNLYGIKKIFVEANVHKDPRERTEDVSRQVNGIVDELVANKNMMVNMIDLKCFDNYTYLHSVNVAVLAIVAAGVYLCKGKIRHRRIFIRQDHYRLGYL